MDENQSSHILPRLSVVVVVVGGSTCSAYEFELVTTFLYYSASCREK